MHALVFDRFGSPDVLEWREVPDPVAAPGTALVRIAAAGVNFADMYRRRGNYHMDATPPCILGYEGAGEIVALGVGDAGPLAHGSMVAFADAPRANAEVVCLPFEKLIPLPPDVDPEFAATLLLQGLTAQYLTQDSYLVREGDLALVHAAAGGVGLLLTQMLAARNAVVVALASTEQKRRAALEAGAAAVLDSAGQWASELRARFGRGADVVYDSVGSTLSMSLEAARTGGTVISYGFAGGDPDPVNPRLLIDRSLTLKGGDLWNVLTASSERRRRADALFELARDGLLQTRVAARIPMRHGADAHRLLESRAVIGKVLLVTA